MSLAAAAFGGAAAPLDSRQADAARIQERLDSAALAAETRRRVQADQVVTSSLDAAAPAAQLQRRSAGNEVEREVGAGSLVVPGLPVLDVLPVSEGTTFAGVRDRRGLEVLVAGDPLLQTTYSSVLLRPDEEAGRAWHEWLGSGAARAAIEAFRLNGTEVFWPLGGDTAKADRQANPS